MKITMTIQEMDFILDVLMKQLKDKSEKNVNKLNRQKQTITKFVKSFDAFYEEADTFPESQKDEIRCEIDPWLILEG